MNKNFLKALALAIAGLLISPVAKAVCPICTVAVVCGVGLSRWLGVDDLISGAWIGGFLVSLSFWGYLWIKTKKYNFKYSWLAIAAVLYAITIVPLYWAGVMGNPQNTFWGIDKLLFGTVSGSVVFILAVYLNNFLKKKNNNKVYFSYQKVVVPVSCLIILSLVFYFWACGNFK